jgi:3-methyladenine DNA glycosylase AlkD
MHTAAANAAAMVVIGAFVAQLVNRGLLDIIEAEMKDAPERLQWAMNTCLGQIGIEHPEHRARALDIGERLEVLKDYPTPPNCTSPFVPIWITEVVRRQQVQ